MNLYYRCVTECVCVCEQQESLVMRSYHTHAHTHIHIQVCSSMGSMHYNDHGLCVVSCVLTDAWQWLEDVALNMLKGVLHI